MESQIENSNKTESKYLNPDLTPQKFLSNMQDYLDGGCDPRTYLEINFYVADFYKSEEHPKFFNEIVDIYKNAPCMVTNLGSTEDEVFHLGCSAADRLWALNQIEINPAAGLQ